MSHITILVTSSRPFARECWRSQAAEPCQCSAWFLFIFSSAGIMSDFEDDNPFKADGEDAPSENESHVVDLSAPSTPPSHPARILSPPISSPPLNRTIRPQTAPQRPAHNAPKAEYCCAKDRWLHSGEDVEIQVCLASHFLEFVSF